MGRRIGRNRVQRVVQSLLVGQGNNGVRAVGIIGTDIAEPTRREGADLVEGLGIEQISTRSGGMGCEPSAVTTKGPGMTTSYGQNGIESSSAS
jgi:hypothetical protein